MTGPAGRRSAAAAGASTESPGTRLAVVAAGGADAAFIADELTAAGLRVGSVIDLDDRHDGSAPRDRLAVSARDLIHAADRARCLPGRPDLAAQLDRYSAGLVGRLLLDRVKPAPGGRIAASDVNALLSPMGLLPRLLTVLLDAAGRYGFLRRDADAVVFADDIEARVATALDQGERLAPLRGVRRLVEHCVDGLPAVLDGEREPVSVLYPDGEDTLLADCTRDNDIALSDATACLDVVGAALGGLCAPPPDLDRQDRPWRVLEVGAGGGELTRRLLGALPANADVVYHVTDVSAVQVRRTASRLSAPGRVDLRFSVFDMAADPVPCGLTPGTFDLVVAYNAVHVPSDLPATLRNLGALLRPGGRLGLVETTRVALWSHLVWGLAPGWWDFDDGLRARSAELDADRWRSALTGHGFTNVEVWDPGPDADHAAILATVRTEPGPAPASHAGPGSSAGPARRLDLSALVRSELDRQRPARLERTAPAGLSAQTDPADPATSRASQSPPPPGATIELAAGVAGQWIRTLGVAAARDADDFFDLGGDSLSAVQLVARLREELHVEVPLGEFLREPTFAGLRELAERSAPPAAGAATGPVSRPAPPRDLVVFRAEGDLTPLFLAAPAAGSSLCYRDLAALLGPRQPVFGLDAPGLDGRTRPPRTIEQIAERHLAALRAARPHGPYTLGGWSTGALVAHEMARRLAGLGERVELLLCLDGYVPETGGRPLASVPGHLAAGLLFQGQSMLRAGRIGGQLRARPDAGRVFGASVRAMLRYRPRSVPCPAVLVQTGLTGPLRDRLRARMEPLYPGGVRILPAEGNHWTVLSRRHAAGLAGTVAAELARAHGDDAAVEHAH